MRAADHHHKLHPVMSLLFKTKTVSADKNERSFFAIDERQLGWLLLAILACLMVFGGAGFGLALRYQSFAFMSFGLA